MPVIDIHAVTVATVFVGFAYIYVSFGVIFWQEGVRNYQGADHDELLMHLSMTHWGWWRRRWALLGLAQFIAFWPVWYLLGFLVARIKP